MSVLGEIVHGWDRWAHRADNLAQQLQSAPSSMDEQCNGNLFTRSNLEKSQVLIDTLAEFDLQMTLPKDIPMLQALSTGNHTRPGNIYISSPITG